MIREAGVGPETINSRFRHPLLDYPVVSDRPERPTRHDLWRSIGGMEWFCVLGFPAARFSR
jgi:hypothetical protein